MIISSKRLLTITFTMLLSFNIYGCSKHTPSDKPDTQAAPQASITNIQPSPTSKPQSSPVPTQASPTISPERVMEAEKLYEQGFGLYNEFKYDEAITNFTMSIDADPTNYKAYNGKGIALCFKGNYKAGMELIRKSLEIKPDFAYANFNMAMAYKLQNDLSNSLIWFEKSLSYDSTDPWSYYGISTIHADWNNVEKSLGYLKKAIVLEPAVKDVARSQSHYDRMRNHLSELVIDSKSCLYCLSQIGFTNFTAVQQLFTGAL